MLDTMALLQDALVRLGSGVRLREVLHGGVVSQVYAGTLDGVPVVVKHTEDFAPSYPAGLFIDKDTHRVDTHVLRLLRDTAIRVPAVIEVYPSITTTVMEDLGCDGYRLLSGRILDRRLPLESAATIGTALARLARQSRTWRRFDTVESARSSLLQRGLELRIAYPNDPKEYLLLVEEHLREPQSWVWPDAYPKNMLLNVSGEPAFIDFGESYWGDQRFTLSSFLAHIVTYAIAGHIDPPVARTYVAACADAYTSTETVDERVLCKYTAMEMFHRANGRWIDGISTIEQKLALYRFSLHAFETAQSIRGLINAIR